MVVLGVGKPPAFVGGRIPGDQRHDMRPDFRTPLADNGHQDMTVGERWSQITQGNPRPPSGLQAIIPKDVHHPPGKCGRIWPAPDDGEAAAPARFVYLFGQFTSDQFLAPQRVDHDRGGIGATVAGMFLPLQFAEEFFLVWRGYWVGHR